MTTNAEAQPRGLSRFSLLVVGMGWFAIILDGYDLVVYGAVVPSLLGYQQWEITPQEAGVIGAYTPIGALFGALIVGTITDIFGRRKTIIGCVAWFSGATALCALAPSPEIFGFCRFLAGLGIGGLIPTATALVAEYSPRRIRSFAYALMLTGIPIGGMLSAFLGILLINSFGWRVMFVAGALPALIFIPLALRYLPESVAFLTARGRTAEAEAVTRRFRIPEEVETATTAEVEEEGAVAPGIFGMLKSLFSKSYAPATFVFWIVNFFSFFIIYGLIAWLPQIMVEAGYDLESALSFLLTYNVGAIVGSVLFSLAADRFGSKPTIVFTFLLTASSITLLSFQWPTLALYAFVAFAGAGVVASQILILAYISKVYPSRMRATALGWAMGVGRIGSVIAPPFLGILIGSGLGVNWNFYAIAIPGLLGALLILLGPRYARSRSATAPAPERETATTGN